MDPLALLLIGVVVGANNLAVAVALGALGQAPRRWRIAGVFGVFELTVPLVGLMIGGAVSELLADTGRWIGAGLLAALGMATLVAANRRMSDAWLAGRASGWTGLVALAGGLSLDNLVVGFALGLNEVSALLVATVIATCSVAFTLVGLEVGARGRRTRRSATETVSGALLIALALAVGIGLLD